MFYCGYYNVVEILLPVNILLIFAHIILLVLCTTLNKFCQRCDRYAKPPFCERKTIINQYPNTRSRSEQYKNEKHINTLKNKETILRHPVLK
jgi:hypothetical protein